MKIVHDVERLGTAKVEDRFMLNQCVEDSPQLASSEWSLQSGLPSQSTETETHSSLCAHANCPDPQGCTGTFGPLEDDVGKLGVTG